MHNYITMTRNKTVCADKNTQLLQNIYIYVYVYICMYNILPIIQNTYHYKYFSWKPIEFNLSLISYIVTVHAVWCMYMCDTFILL
jgi:hypothetical protein